MRAIVLSHIQDFPLVLIEFYLVSFLPFLQIIKFILDPSTTLQSVYKSTKLVSATKFTKSPLHPTFQILKENMKQYWTQIIPLGNPTTDTSSQLDKAIDDYSLSMIIELYSTFI